MIEFVLDERYCISFGLWTVTILLQMVSPEKFPSCYHCNAL